MACSVEEMFKDYIKDEKGLDKKSELVKNLENSQLTKAEFIKKELEKDLKKTEILARIESEINAIQKSEQIFKESDIGGAPEVIRTGSNTPKWLKEKGVEINKKQLEKTLKELTEGKIDIPDKNNIKQTYMQAFLEQLDSKLADMYLDDGFKKFDDSSIKIKKLELELKDNELFLEKTLQEIERLEAGQKIKKGERVKFKINKKLERDRDSARREKSRLEKRIEKIKLENKKLKDITKAVIEEKIALGKKLLDQHEKYSKEIHKIKTFSENFKTNLENKVEQAEQKYKNIINESKRRKKEVTELETFFEGIDNGLSRGQILKIRREIGEYKAHANFDSYQGWLNRYIDKLEVEQLKKNARLTSLTKLYEKDITRIENLFERNSLPSSISRFEIKDWEKFDKLVEKIEKGSTILGKKMIERLELVDESSQFKNMKTQQEVAGQVKKTKGMTEYIKEEKQNEIKSVEKDIEIIDKSIKEYEKQIQKNINDDILVKSFTEEVQTLKGIIKNKRKFVEKLKQIKDGSLQESMNFIEKLTTDEKVHSDALIRGKNREKFMYDSSLGEQNPMYHRMILRFGEQRAKYQNKLLKTMEPFYKTLTEARKERSILESSQKSTKEKVLDWFIPEDRHMFSVMEETNLVKRSEMMKQLTPKEKKAVEMMTKILDDTKGELTLREALDNPIDGYLTHMGKTTAEILKNDSFVAAWNNVWKNDLQRMDYQNVGDGKGISEVLGSEKFFRFNIKRKGGLSYSKDIGLVMGRYMNTVYKKFTLDDVIPEAKLLSDLLGDGQAKKNINAWLNNKKGTHIESYIEQGGKIEKIFNAHKMYFTLKQLGWNPITAAFSPIGATMSNFINLTGKEYRTGLERKYLSKEKANKILDDNAGILGRNPLLEIKTDFLNDASTPNYMKVINSAWIMLGTSMNAAVKTNFLGRLTKSEWEMGKVSNERIGEIMYEMGRHHALPGTNSIYGSTALAKYGMTYKSWAVPLAHSTIRDFAKVMKGEADKRTQARVAKTLALTIGLGLLYINMTDEDKGKYSVKRAYQEGMGQIGAFDPQFWLGSAGISDIKRATGIIFNIGTFAEYKTSDSTRGYEKGDLKGINQLIRYMQPGAYRSTEKVIDEWK